MGIAPPDFDHGFVAAPSLPLNREAMRAFLHDGRQIGSILVDDPASLEYLCESAPGCRIAVAGSLPGSLIREGAGQER